MTSSRIEPATFRLVTQCLYQLTTLPPPPEIRVQRNKLKWRTEARVERKPQEKLKGRKKENKGAKKKET
jgi:hypothetical protein